MLALLRTERTEAVPDLSVIQLMGGPVVGVAHKGDAAPVLGLVINGRPPPLLLYAGVLSQIE